MNYHAIVIKDNEISETAFERLQKSTSVQINKFDAITPVDVQETMSILGLRWNYPWINSELDFGSGLLKTPYATQNKLTKIACALSHYCLWKKCAELNENFLILEHDAIFINEIDFDPDDLSFKAYARFDIIGINDPRGATRKSGMFHEIVQKNEAKYQRPPVIDDLKIPQGIAGNSAYIMRPAGAKHMLSLVDQYGLWHNDAIMCRQLVPRLGVSRKYYTRVQGTRSTSTQ